MMNQGMGGGYQPDPIGNRKPQGVRSENEVLARVQDVSSKVEDAIEQYTQVRPSRICRGGANGSLSVLISPPWLDS